ncbi:MAG TPA: molybdopterin-dependent oxidoreductase [Vicinamibacterales bacterium]|nr:molybdopterin-dependent oxidoreductase [Vicinamibacterales bacterium]
MKQPSTRREMITQSAAGLAWLAALGIPESAWARQDGEELVTLTDYTASFQIEASASTPRVRCVDLRGLTSWVTPNDEHYAFSQTRAPEVDAATYRLRVGGFVTTPLEFTLEELKVRPDRRDEGVTLECSGNSTRAQRMSGLLSNGVWTGVGLKAILDEAGVKPEAREVLFLGLDMEKEKKFQAGNREYAAPHGRAIYLADALHPDTMLAFALNGEPLPREQGFPVRLLVPGWYGMTQVKWLGRIEVLDRRYEGQHQVRNYLSLRSIDTPEGPLFIDTSISKNRLKSIVARVTRRRRDGDLVYKISGPAWGGQVPIAGVEVQVDGGPWQPATIEPSEQALRLASKGKYSWVLWTYSVPNLAPGLHTVVSRAIDGNGTVQPTSDERRAEIASGREDNSQWVREIRVD